MSTPRSGASAPGTVARRRRRRSPFAATVSLLLIVALAGSALVGGWLALTATPQGQRLVGAPVVVPEDLRPVLRKAARRCEAVPVRILAAQIAAESAWDPNAVSPVGASGIAQFMPEVWEQYGIDANNDGVADVWDPVDAIHSAAALNCINRRLVRDASGNRLRNTLAAYNAGFGSVLKYDGVPPYPETETYVARILEYAKTIELSEPTTV